MMSLSDTTDTAKLAPSRLANLKELVQHLSLSIQIQAEVSAILEDLHIRLYSVEEDRKRLLATVRDLEGKNRSLEKRYSELLYKFSEFKNGHS